MSEAEFNRRLAEIAISHDDAKEVASRLIAGAFNRTDMRPRFSIPTRPDDDDVLMMEYIRRQKVVESNAARVSSAEDVRQATLDEVEKVLKREMIPHPHTHGGDRQYNSAIGRCIAVVRALGDRPAAA
jgi:hypothetical protein